MTNKESKKYLDNYVLYKGNKFKVGHVDIKLGFLSLYSMDCDYSIKANVNDVVLLKNKRTEGTVREFMIKIQK